MYNSCATCFCKIGTEIGKGRFGRVLKGSWTQQPNGQKLDVVIKMCMDVGKEYCVNSILREEKIYSYVGKHENVVELLGTVLDVGVLQLVLEYCQHKSLKEVFGSYDVMFFNQILDDQVNVQLK